MRCSFNTHDVVGGVLFGMIMFRRFPCGRYLESRSAVESQCLVVLGMWMEAAKAWWQAVPDPRVKVCMDICCLAADELINTQALKEQGIYYYFPPC